MGDYFRDVLEIGGARIENTTMGLGRLTNIPYGLAGIGYHHVVALTRVTGQEYYNLPLHMEQQGLISTVGYSLWLNDLSKKRVGDHAHLAPFCPSSELPLNKVERND